MIRTFIALKIPEEIIENIFNLIYSIDNNYKFNWEQKNKIHLTLKFLGDIKPAIVPQIINELDFLNDFNVQSLELKNFGMFFHKKEPKIFWAGLNTSKELIEVVDKIELTLEKFGIEKEKRPFKPHLTLLRIKNNLNIDFLYKLVNFNFEPIVFQTDSIVFYKSELLPTGSVYKSLHKFHLKQKELK